MKRPYGWSVCVPPEGAAKNLWMTEQALDLLKPECWMNWLSTPFVDHPGYTPTMGREFDYNAVQLRMRANSDESWIWLNEPERPEQANKTPIQAVKMTRQFLNAGWDIDAAFNWCGPNCAVNLADHNGEAWMREYLKLLRLSGLKGPSYVGIHLYNSTDRLMVQRTFDKLPSWRYQFLGFDTPIVVTEFCAENQPLSFQIEVMDVARHMLSDGKIKGAYWFYAFYTGWWPNCCLCEVDPSKTETMRLTDLGKHWVSLR